MIFRASVAVSRSCAVVKVSRDTKWPWALASKKLLGISSSRSKRCVRITWIARKEIRDSAYSPATEPAMRASASPSISAGNAQA